MRSKIFVIIVMFLIGTVGYAQEISQKGEIPFDVREIIERSSHRFPPSEQTEFLIDTHVVYTPSCWNQGYVDIAFDGINYLVVWEEQGNTYGTRFTTSGTVLDTVGIPISTGSGAQEYPAVAFDGTNYFVVWQDSRSGSSDDIYGSRVSTSGTVLDLGGIAISTATSHQLVPAVTFDGTNYLVVWHDRRNGMSYDIYGARVSTSGTVLDPGSIAISTATDNQYYPGVAFDGTNYLVVWEDYRNGSDFDVYCSRVTTSGTVLDPGGIAISTATKNQFEPTVAFDGTNYFVVWADYRDNNTDIYGSRVTTSGTVLDPSGIGISTDSNTEIYPALVFDGTNYFVTWQERSPSNFDIYGSRVSTSGTILDPTGIAISTAPYDQEYSAVAFDGTNYLVVWQDLRLLHSYDRNDYDIYGSRVTASGTVLDPNGIPLPTMCYHQFNPAVAFDGENYLVVWQDGRNIATDIYGARVDTLGTVLDPGCIAISTAATTDQFNPAIAFDGTNYLVVWTDYRNDAAGDIYGTRVSTSGTVLDPGGIAISTATSVTQHAAVAFDGTNYFVVWQDWRSGLYFHIYGTRVSISGTVLEPSGIAITSASTYHRQPAIAFDGTNYFVVWYHGSFSSANIYGSRVSISGTVLDPGGIAISTATNSQVYPSVVFNGENYLVVWQDDRSGSNYDIYGARVDTLATVLDPSGIAISTATNSQQYPSVASSATNYLVIWQDNRSGTDIYGAKIDFLGIVLEEVPVSVQSGDQCWPCLAVGPDSQTVVTYSGFVDSINSKPANTMRIWGKFYPFGLVGVSEDLQESKSLSRLCIYPNPFSMLINISFNIGQSTKGKKLRIYDVSGRIVKEFSLPTAYSLMHTVISWDGTDNRGNYLPNGIYFVHIKTKDYSLVERAILLQ